MKLLRRCCFFTCYVLEETRLTFESFVTLRGTPNKYENWRDR